MNDTDTTALDADRAEFAALMRQADAGRLVPATAARLEVLRHRIAAAEGQQASADLTAAADQLRARGHR